MRKRSRQPRKSNIEYTGIKMERDLYDMARERARSPHQTYSEYVRQLIVQDVQPTQEATA